MSWRWPLRSLGYAFLSLLGLLVLSLALGGYLLHSEKGSRWLVEHLPEMVPGQLRVEKFEGRFTGPLRIENLHYTDAGLSLDIRRIGFDWQPRALLQGRLQLLDLDVTGTRLQLPASQEPPQPSPAPAFTGFELPLELWVDSVNIEDLQVLQPDGAAPLRLERLILRARAARHRISIEQLEAEAFSARVQVDGSVELSPGLPLDLHAAWRYQLPEGPELRGEGEVSGNLKELRVQQDLAAPVAGQLQASLFDLLEALRWDAGLSLQEADIGAFTQAFPARIKGQVHSHGTLQRIEAEAQLDLTEASLGKLKLDLAAGYADGEIRADRLNVKGSDGLSLEGRGRFRPQADAGVLTADLNWRGLRWPLTGGPVQFLSKSGELHIEGRPDDYRYRLALDARLPETPPLQGRVTSSGSGDLQGLKFDELSLALPEGRIQGSGRAAWSPEPSWQAQLAGEGLNPGLFDPEFPGNLSLAVQTEGRVHESVPQVQLVLQKLQGELRGYPLQGSGQASLEGERLSLSGVEVQSGANRLDLQGRVGTQLDLAWELHAPHLESLLPDLAGSVDARGTLRGERDMPQVSANLEARQLRYKEDRIGDLAATADVDLAGSQRLELQLKAGQLHLGQGQWDSLTVSLTGRRAAHQLEVALTGGQGPGLDLALDAALSEDSVWSGDLRELTLQLRDYGAWKLAAPAAFSLAAASQTLGQTCLRSAEASVCGGFQHRTGEAMSGDLLAERIPLSLLRPWLPEETQLTGEADLRAEFSAPDPRTAQGSARLTLPRAKLEFDLGGGPQQIDLSGGQVSADLDGRSGRGKLELPLVDVGAIQGEIELPGFNPLEPDLQRQAMQGWLKAHIDNLELLSALLPNLQDLHGAIAADLKVGGTLAEPALQGQAGLTEGKVDLPELGLELRDLQLHMAATDLQRVKLTGQVRSGKGLLQLNGETRLLSEQGFPTELHIEGKDWVGVDIPEAEVQISPKLVINYRQGRTDLNGEVHIPYARIRPRQMPESAVTGSPDLQVVGGGAKSQPRDDLKLHAKLRIIFGDRVSFDGIGLRGNLTGNLLVTDEPGRPVTASGRIGVVDGTYKAYGQDLKLERGYALFADSPVDNPGLDVRAVREVEDVSVGLRVTGTLKKPRLNLFSTPAMSDNEVLTYLLTGHAPGESGSGQSVGISAALQAAGAGNLASELGRQFGLEELRVETNGAMAEASVVAGTYLSPRLYVQYVNDLATRETKVRLRYDLTKSLQIQTESGQSQGVDLFYTIER